MCGRFAITLPDDAMAALFDAVPSNDLPAIPNYNVCPTNQIHTVTSEDGARRLRPMCWGFLPHWYKKTNGGPLLINARAETIAEKPAFKAACRDRRCIIVHPPEVTEVGQIGSTTFDQRRAEERAHPIENVGKGLRAMMGFLGDPATAKASEPEHIAA